MSKKVSWIVIFCSAFSCALSLDECDAIVGQLNQQPIRAAARWALASPLSAVGPSSNQTSLIIAFDSTGSMSRDLIELRAAALEIIDDFSSRAHNPIYNYILTFFNDPGE